MIELQTHLVRVLIVLALQVEFSPRTVRAIHPDSLLESCTLREHGSQKLQEERAQHSHDAQQLQNEPDVLLPCETISPQDLVESHREGVCSAARSETRRANRAREWRLLRPRRRASKRALAWEESHIVNNRQRSIESTCQPNEHSVERIDRRRHKLLFRNSHRGERSASGPCQQCTSFGT